MEACSMAACRRTAELALQQAPTNVVVDALTAESGWDDLDAQSQLYAQLVESAAWSQLPFAYRQRLLKRILNALRSAEVLPDLLEAYLQPAPRSGDDGASTPGADDNGSGSGKWSIRTYQLGSCAGGGPATPLSVRVGSGIGGGTEARLQAQTRDTFRLCRAAQSAALASCAPFDGCFL